MYRLSQSIAISLFSILLTACGGGSSGSSGSDTPSTAGGITEAAQNLNTSSQAATTSSENSASPGNTAGTRVETETGASNGGTAATARSDWEITDLTAAVGADSVPTAINNAGDVIGNIVVEFAQSPGASNKENAFLYRQGKTINLGSLGGTFTNAIAINDKGVIVGLSATDRGALPWLGYKMHGFVYDSHAGGIQDFTALGGNFNVLTGINNAGQIIGIRDDRAVLFTNGINQDLGTLPGTTVSAAQRLNARGMVLGISYVPGNSGSYRSFLYADGAMKDLSRVPGCKASFFAALNDAGQLAGHCDGRLVISTGESLKEMGSLPGYVNPGVKAMNNAGQVVGFATTPGNNTAAGDTVFLYDGNRLIDLNTVPSIAASGWKLLNAFDINDAGQIIGQGTRDGKSAFRYFLLTPPGK